MSGLSVLAVDDEPSQLEDLARLLEHAPQVGRVDRAGDGRDALAKASAQRYDAIFLDVRMPGLSGLELGQALRRFAAPPQLVFVSAHDESALEAFELRAVDYLPKPVSRRRLADTLDRLHLSAPAPPGGPMTEGDDAPASALAPAHTPAPKSEMIGVASVPSGSTRLISRTSVLYVRSHGDFVRVVTEEGRHLLRATLAEIERRWEPHGFVRVHRQYVVNLARAVELRPLFGGAAELLFAGGQSVPVSRRHAADLTRRLEP